MSYPKVERPTEPGWYFFRWGSEDWSLFQVKKPKGYGLRAYAFGSATHFPVGPMSGQWRGPIPQPEE